MTPKQAYCSEKKRLLEEFQNAISEYLHAVSLRMQARLRRQESFFEARLQTARQRKDAAEEAITAHQELHSC